MNHREDNASKSAWAVIITILLMVVTAMIYWPVRSFAFVSLDDVEYVTQKPWVQTGLTWDGFHRAWTEPVAANWHPLTMLTHMTDCQLFGMKSGWHHLTNLAFHVACSVLVFWVLLSMTGRLWPAAVVAALFAWHPLRVESVAWISERKDVLSGTLALCVIGAYVAYVRDMRWWRYLMVFLFLALGLLAKPMLVTLPAVLLLLDYWPLHRLRGWDDSWKNSVTRYAWLALEKLPLFLLVVISSVITFYVQRDQGAVEAVEKFPLSGRITNAIVTYVVYLGKMVWPQDLAVPYPLASVAWTGTQVFLAASFLVVVSMAAWHFRRRYPWLIVGWLWYLGMLVPVIGIIQVGRQSMADRYTYLPSLGICIAIVWSVAYWAGQRPVRQVFASLVALGALTAFAVAAHQQTGYWRTSEDLYEHALAVTQNNATAHLGLAAALANRGELEAAAEHYRRGLELEPESHNGHYYLGVILLSQRVELDEAERNLQIALSRGYNPASTYARLGEVYLLQDRLEPARDSFQAALLSPGQQLPETVVGMAVALVRMGAPEAAINLLEQSLQNGFHSKIADKLAWIYATHPDDAIRNEAAALELAEKVCRRTSNSNPAYLDTLAAALAANGRFEEAMAAGTSALRQIREWQRTQDAPQWDDLSKALEIRLATYGREEAFRDDPLHLKF